MRTSDIDAGMRDLRDVGSDKATTVGRALARIGERAPALVTGALPATSGGTVFGDRVERL